MKKLLMMIIVLTLLGCSANNKNNTNSDGLANMGDKTGVYIDSKWKKYTWKGMSIYMDDNLEYKESSYSDGEIILYKNYVENDEGRVVDYVFIEFMTLPANGESWTAKELVELFIETDPNQYELQIIDEIPFMYTKSYSEALQVDVAKLMTYYTNANADIVYCLEISAPVASYEAFRKADFIKWIKTITFE